jgi:uncharacterized protein
MLSVGACSPTERADGGQAIQYERRELTIPVRDGTKLFAVALIPKGTHLPLPIVLIRTPFSAAVEFRTAALPPAFKELAEDGYIFVTEDVRGRNGSGGTFVTNRAQADAANPAGTNESTDAYDTIDWLVKNLSNNNGKVGVLGISYRGWLAALAGVGAHPALKAISPQAPMSDTWLGDDFFHQGAFRETQGVAYAAWVESGKGPAVHERDEYDLYLRLATLGQIGRAMGVTQLPSWAGFRAHPSRDAYWDAKALQGVLTKAEVPMLFVGGWWDAEDMRGPQDAYNTVARADTKGLARIVLGPWVHGEWAKAGGDSVGPIRLGSNTADYFREKIQRPWFAYYLHGAGDGHFPKAWAFETGENQWHTFDEWPPRDAAPRNLYLREHGVLSFDPPGSAVRGTQSRGPDAATSGEYDAYTSDPAHPIPNLPRPDDGSGWATWLERDQRFVGHRPDMLTWVSEPLTQDLTIAGDVVAHLFASTTGTDADWTVKLIDVYPDSVPGNRALGGYQLMVNADIMRGRYWKSFSQATPIPANTVTPFNVDLNEQLYRFSTGHRVMVQVQSTWFPLYDRNPQLFIPNIFDATPADFRAQVHRVWHTPTYPSHVSVSALPPSAMRRENF